MIEISQVGELWANGDVISWPDLQSEFQLAPGEMYKYLQICHAFRSALPQGLDIPEASPLEIRLLEEQMSKKATSLTYRKIINNMSHVLLQLKAQ